MAAILHLIDQRRLIDSNGISDGGSLGFYLTTTLTPATIYSDSALTTPLTNPVVVAAGGAVPIIYLDGEVSYRRIITYSDGSTDDDDPYQVPDYLALASASETAAAASAVTAAASAASAAAAAERAEAALAGGYIYATTGEGVTARPTDGDGWWLIISGGIQYYTTQSSVATASTLIIADSSQVTAALAAAVVGAAALDGVPWIAAEGITLTGAATGETWTTNRLAVAKAIKEVYIYSPSMGASEQYYIGIFSHNDGTNKDRIAIRRESDNATVWDLGAVDVTERTDGLTEIQFGYRNAVPSDFFVHIVVDYRELSGLTGNLVAQATTTPLIISRAASEQAGKRLMDRAKAQGQVLRNLSTNSALNADFSLPSFTATPTLTAPTNTALSARGISQVVRLGTGGVQTFLKESVSAGEIGQNYVAMRYVESDTAGSFSIPKLFFYNGATLVEEVILNFLPLSTTARLYFKRGVVPASTTERRWGTTSATGGAADIRHGGHSFFTSAGSLNLFDVPHDQWYPSFTDEAALADVSRRLALVQVGEGVAPFDGEDWVINGDSIVGNYDLVTDLATETGATSTNAGFGGCTLTGQILSYADRLAAVGSALSENQNKEFFSGVQIAKAISLAVLSGGTFADQETAADNMVANNGSTGVNDYRARVDALQAIDWANLDRMLIAYGTNDFNSGIAIGSIGDDGYGGSTPDTTTIYGAINYIVDQIQTAIPSLQIGLLPPMWRFNNPIGAGTTDDEEDGYTTTNSAGLSLIPYQDAIVAGCEKHNIPALKIHEVYGANRFNYLTYLGDGLHPSTVAGKARWVNRVFSLIRGVWR